MYRKLEYLDDTGVDELAFVGACDACSGYGKIRHNAYTSVSCTACKGTGSALTVTGTQLIAFLHALGVSMPTPDGWRIK